MSIHGFQRFLDNHEYRTTVPVTSLFFEVTVHRALVVEEANKTQIAKETIAFGTKLPSLVETLASYKGIIARREEMARAAVANGGSPQQISEAILEEEDPAGMAAYRLVMGAEGNNVVEKMQNVCNMSAGMIFTRPPYEDYIPSHEEVNVVDPPNEPTPLTIAMLRDHRNRNMPSTKMHFGIALGTIAPTMGRGHGAFARNGMPINTNGGEVTVPLSPEKEKARREREERKERDRKEKEAKKNKKKAKKGGDGDAAAAAEGEDAPIVEEETHENHPASDAVEMLQTNANGDIVTFDQNASSLDNYGFAGHEIILASVDNVGENEMRCRPSLVDEHTCFVDAEYIYTFTISITDQDPAKVAAAANKRAGSVAGSMFASGVRNAMMVKMFASMMKNTLRASRRLVEGSGTLFQSQAREERDRQILLKQVIMNRLQQQKVPGASAIDTADLNRDATSYGYNAGAAKGLPPSLGGGGAAAGNRSHHHGKNTVTFTPAPEQPGTMRLHVMGVIENCYNIPQDSLFVRYKFILPDGCVQEATYGNGAEITNSGSSSNSSAYTDKGTLAAVDPAVANLAAAANSGANAVVTSQLAWASRIRDEDYVYRTMHTFNLPLELHCTIPINSPTPIRLIMKFYSKGSGGDYFQTAEGYGQQTIPMFAGTYDFEVLLWRPKPTAYEYLKSVFIGGSPRLADDEDVAIPPHVVDGISSRAGLQTESSGMVRLKFNIISHMRPEGADDDRFKRRL